MHGKFHPARRTVWSWLSASLLGLASVIPAAAQDAVSRLFDGVPFERSLSSSAAAPARFELAGPGRLDVLEVDDGAAVIAVRLDEDPPRTIDCEAGLERPLLYRNRVRIHCESRVDSRVRLIGRTYPRGTAVVAGPIALPAHGRSPRSDHLEDRRLVPPGQETTLMRLTGSGEVRSLHLRSASLTGARLRAHTSGHPKPDIDWTLLAGTITLPELSLTADRLETTLPLPFEDGVRISFEHWDDQPQRVTLTVSVDRGAARPFRLHIAPRSPVPGDRWIGQLAGESYWLDLASPRPLDGPSAHHIEPSAHWISYRHFGPSPESPPFTPRLRGMGPLSEHDRAFWSIAARDTAAGGVAWPSLPTDEGAVGWMPVTQGFRPAPGLYLMHTTINAPRPGRYRLLHEGSVETIWVGARAPKKSWGATDPLELQLGRNEIVLVVRVRHHWPEIRLEDPRAELR
ncbi:MAG: hypothetical protein RL885_03570 [Planctomycetota bacterium]